MCAHFELLARLAVDVRRAEYSENLAFSGQRDRACNAGAGALCCLDDVCCRTIEDSLVVTLESYPYLFLSLFCHNSLYFFVISSCSFVGTRSKWLGSIVYDARPELIERSCVE